MKRYKVLFKKKDEYFIKIFREIIRFEIQNTSAVRKYTRVHEHLTERNRYYNYY